MKKMSILLALLLLVGLVLTACGNGGPQGTNSSKAEAGVGVEVEDTKAKVGEVQRIIDKGKLVLGTNADYPPFEFHAIIDGKDQIVGLDIEIGKYIADSLGVELEIKDMAFNNLLAGLDTGMLDIVIAGMNPKPERKANFSDIYYEANFSVLIHKDNADQINSLEDLTDKAVGVQIATVQEDIAKNELNDSEIISLQSSADLVMNLKTKKIHATIMETPVAQSFAKVNDDIMMVEGLVLKDESGGVAIAVKEGNDELTEKINEILAEIKEKGLIEKWFAEAQALAEEKL